MGTWAGARVRGRGRGRVRGRGRRRRRAGVKASMETLSLRLSDTHLTLGGGVRLLPADVPSCG